MTSFCRSSDLLPFVLPSHLSLKDSGLVVGRQTSKRWSSQQRDCSGLSPDSLFIRDFAERKSKRNKTLQIYGFPEKTEINSYKIIVCPIDKHHGCLSNLLIQHVSIPIHCKTFPLHILWNSPTYSSKFSHKFSVPLFGFYISHCEIYIPHCGFYIPQCGTENSQGYFHFYARISDKMRRMKLHKKCTKIFMKSPYPQNIFLPSGI